MSFSRASAVVVLTFVITVRFISYLLIVIGYQSIMPYQGYYRRTPSSLDSLLFISQ